jgi:hypothetical protein
VDILVEIDPEACKSYVSQDKKGNKQLLVQFQNALYGTMVASLLYYQRFVKSLTDIDFIINPYDPCVANRIIEGKQMTICSHVDTCKLSHRKKTVIERMIEYLRQEYESIIEDGSGAMTVSRGKIHKYLGVTLDYSVPGQVKITMLKYVNEILAAFDKAEPKGGGTKTGAAPDSLFKVDEECEKIAHVKAADSQDLVIFNQARKKFSRSSISQEGRPKIHPSFTSLLQNNLFRKTIFFTFTRIQETREYRLQNGIPIPTIGTYPYTNNDERMVSSPGTSTGIQTRVSICKILLQYNNRSRSKQQPSIHG